MTGRVLHFDSAAHKVTDVLLPWFVNGTLEGDELAFVQEHLGQCARCQREVEWLREFHAACVAASAVPGSSPAVHHLRRQLEEPRKARGMLDRLRAHWRDARPWSRRVFVAQLANRLVVLDRRIPRDSAHDSNLLQFNRFLLSTANLGAT